MFIDTCYGEKRVGQYLWTSGSRREQNCAHIARNADNWCSILLLRIRLFVARQTLT